MIAAPLTCQDPGLDEVTDALFEEERVPLGARDQEGRERLEAGVIPQEGLKQFFGASTW